MQNPDTEGLPVWCCGVAHAVLKFRHNDCCVLHGGGAETDLKKQNRTPKAYSTKKQRLMRAGVHCRYRGWCIPRMLRALAEYNSFGFEVAKRGVNSRMTGPLPEFDSPPLIEVALSVQFEKLSDLGVPQLGLIWQRFRDRFPVTQEHPPLDPTFEEFGRALAFRRRIQFQLTQTIPIPRLWFLNTAGTDLVQVQSDRFIRNWKTGEEEQPYPRYTVLRENFQRDWECFCRALDDEGIDRPFPNQCEVTYVNMLPSGEGWEDYGDLDRVVGIFAQNYSDDFLGKPENAAVNASYRMLRDDESNAGRLHVSVEPVTRQADKRPCWRLKLTARGQPIGGSTDDVLEFFDRGHEYVVQGFDSLTSKTMHTIWGRRQ